MSENLEAERKGERFTLIEPPLLPVEPAKPNRFGVAVISVALALIFGFGAVGLAEAMDNKIRGRRGVQQLLTAPPLATIPYVYVDGEQQTGPGWKKIALALMALGLLFLVLVHFAYKPLDVIYFVVLRKLGL